MAKHDVVTELFYDDAWQQVPAYTRDPVTITRGRGNETSQPTPQTARLTADNRDGTYNPRNASSPLFGLAGRNTPTRVRVQLIADTFTRTVANGWGTADTDQAWTTLGGSASDYSTLVDRARHSLAAVNTPLTSLIGSSLGDVDQTIRVTQAVVATGGFIARALVWRVGNDFYRCELRFNTDNTVTMLLIKFAGGVTTTLDSVTHTQTYGPGTTLFWLRFQKVGPHLRGRFWHTSSPEPTGWDVDATDSALSGAAVVGCRSVLSSANTNTLPLTVEYDTFSVGWSRFHGEAASWKPRRAIKGDAWTEMGAAGVLRRLGQGTPPSLSPFHRTITSAETIADLLAYWPCEDDVNARQAASALPGGTAMTATTAVDFAASGTSFARNLTAIGFGKSVSPGTDPLPNLNAGGKLTGAVPAGTSSPIEWAVCFVARSNALGAAEDIVLAEWSTPSGTYAFWEVLQDGAGLGTEVAVYNAARTVRTVICTTVDSEIILTEYRVEAEQSGTAIDVRFYADGNLKDSFNGTSNTLARVTQVVANPASNVVSGSVGFYVGHIQVWDTATPPSLGFSLFGQPTQVTDPLGTDIYPWYRWLNETVGERLIRLCAERGIPLTLTGTSTDTVRMGQQPSDTFPALTSECERTDDGLLYEPRDAPGLAYRIRDSLLSQTPVLELDFDAGEIAPPLDPDTDDQGTRNDVTVKNAAGSSYRAVHETGALSVLEPPDGVGRTATTVNVSMALDSDLEDLGDWLLSKGTTDAARYPRVSVDLDAAPALAAAASAVDIGDVIELTNTEDGTVDLLVLGYTETLGSHRRKIVFNCAPADPYA